MANTWSITQGTTTVTLPSAPKIVDDNNPPKIDEFGVDNIGTVLISRFNQARKLRLQGSIFVQGKTNAHLETTYLALLRAMSRLQVTITDPDGQFGGNWLMGEPSFHREAEGKEIRYSYTIEFLQGIDQVVLNSSGGSGGSLSIEGNYTAWAFKWTKVVQTVTNNEHRSISNISVDNNGNVLLGPYGSGSAASVVFVSLYETVVYDKYKNYSADLYASPSSKSVLGTYAVLVGLDVSHHGRTFVVYKNFSLLFSRAVSLDDGILNTSLGVEFVLISPNGKYVVVVTNDSSGYWNYFSLYEGS